MPDLLDICKSSPRGHDPCMDQLSEVLATSPVVHSPICSWKLQTLNLSNGVEDLERSLETHPEHEEGSELSGKREAGTRKPFQRG